MHQLETTPHWEFWIDVGGTFTDCIGRSPDGKLVTQKLLSSGLTKGVVERLAATNAFADSKRIGDPQGFWTGYKICFYGDRGEQLHRARVVDFDCSNGNLVIDLPFPNGLASGTAYELSSGEEAPLVAIRMLMGLTLVDPIPPVAVRLGTTRGTNALLTRRGARTALVTTRGFGDVLRIGYQDRPRLFDLAIRKPSPLFERVIEIDERLDAQGNLITPLDEPAARRDLIALKDSGMESLAICLMHSFANPTHEQIVERIARELGFSEISTSSQLVPLIKIVARGDTTVVDAYLNPILRQYIANLQTAMPGSDVKIMTSSGGLVDCTNFVGKDSILSGPAGGVIGFSRVAQKAGFEKSIGFDMGGTSTDVARFDGRYEHEFETQKAGVRVVAPMLAIETVAAGGGSICGFDGVKLTVGPDSAGADPGPACYGGGGPLTVTDINLYLGKILPDRFPFALDRQVVEQRLHEVCDHVSKGTTKSTPSPIELATGFLRVANANMVRAIRNISVAKGYEPIDHVLVTFGGAGAQHACAIASSLGIRNILVHPYAGILSAYGIGLANVHRYAEQAVLKPYSAATIDGLEPLFGRLETQATSDVLKQGVDQSQVEAPVRSLDMRYQGAEATINVLRPGDGNYTRQFEQQHQQLFGFVRSGSAIEISAARVEVIGTTAEPEDAGQQFVERRPKPTKMTETWFDGTRHQTGVFYREDLRAGDQLAGPCIVSEPTSTVVIDPGFSATVSTRGDIVISATGEACVPKTSEAADPVMLEIFNNLFASIAEQMGTTLERTAFSTNVKERRDFSCAVFSAYGDLVANAPHIPVHLGAMSETVKCILTDNPDMKPGDVYVTNDPYRGGSHLPDITLITPVHDDRTNELLFFTASRAHHAEIGSIVPGSLPPFSTNLAEEGVLIRNFKLIDGGTTREPELIELLTTARYPTRAVTENLADISAQLAANKKGVGLLEELVASYSLPVVQRYMRHIQDAAAQKMRLALAAIPDGEYHRTDHLDDGSPIVVSIRISDCEATVDFTGTGPVIAGNLNANRGIVTAAVLYTFRCMLREEIPLNSGVLDPIRIVLPSCLLNPPEHDDPTQCAAVVGGNVETSSRVVDVLLGALELAAASQGTMNNLTFGDQTFGYYETICGGSGATFDADGADAVHTHMTNTRLTDPEVIEHRYPVRIREFSIRLGSGGAGRQRGGDGIVRRIEFLRPLQVSLLTERRGPYAPFGLAGGEPGALGKNSIQRAGSEEELKLPSKTKIDVGPGDILTVRTPGGGGYGPAE